MSDELNDRQKSLVSQIGAGEITERAPDTEEQLHTLTRLGHLRREHKDGRWHFFPADAPEDTSETASDDAEG